MDRILGGLIFFFWWLFFGLPPRLLALLALMWLGVILWLHRRRCSRSGITGAEAAIAILEGRKLRTKVQEARGRLVDCYLPHTNTITLSERTFRGTSIGALSIAAHEAGHALQARRWFVPWLLRRLFTPLAGIGLALCLWVWLVGLVLQDQRVLLAAGGCFSVYLVFLLFELMCEIDASRRAVRELVRLRILDAAESRIARRILRAALGTYLAAFAGSTLVLMLFWVNVDELADQTSITLDWLKNLSIRR